MVCYTIPIIAAVITFGVIRGGGLKGTYNLWLLLMFAGAGLFGVIDHLWYGELFFISKYWISDLALGVTITSGIFVSWGAIVYVPKLARQLRHRLGVLQP